MRHRIHYLATALAILLGSTVHAQSIPALYSTFTASSGTYTAISGGTVLESAVFDDQVDVVPIPTFFYGGSYYDTLRVSANGFITFGPTSPLGTNYTPISSTAAYYGAISVFGANLVNATSGTPEIRWQQVGNEIIVQWQDVARSTGGTERFSFQARLNVTNGVIKMVYSGVTTLNAATTQQPQVGMRGRTNTFSNSVKNKLVGTGSETWAATLAGTANSSVLRFTSTAPSKSPVAGQTYTATPICLSPVANATPVSDCVTNTFSVTVTITSLGGATNATITASNSVTPITTTAIVGSYLCGPFPLGTPITITVTNNQSVNCVNTLGPFNPTTVCGTIANGDCLVTPLSIPDNGCGQNNEMQAVIPFSGLHPVLGPANGQTMLTAVELIIAHTYRGDLRVWLTSPTGQSRNLLLQEPNPSASGSNFGNPGGCPGVVVQLRDDATQPISAISGTLNNVSGVFLPEQSLSGFTGNPNGNWVLHVCDNSPEDVGNLAFVRVRLDNVDCTPGAACNDGSACTTNDVLNGNCQCTGTQSSLQASGSASVIACNGGNSQVTVTASGGTAPYTGAGIFSRTAGTYTFPVSDATGCQVYTPNVVITEPAVLTGTATITTVVPCNGGNGVVTVAAAGGTAPYSGTGNFTRTAGTYTFPITDAHGCATAPGVTITQPAVLSGTAIVTTAIACNGGSGTVTVSASGGTAPYSGTGTFGRTAGTYSFTVTDAHGCTISPGVTVTQPAILTATASIFTPIACNGGNAVVSVAASGGTGPYTGTGNFTRAAGTYSFPVTDAHGCATTANITVTQPAVLTASAVLTTAILCNGGNATVTVSGSGGTAPYSGTGALSRAAGTWTFTITDGKGCTANTSSLTVTEPALLVASAVLSQPESGCNTNDAKAVVSATGGTPAYSGTGQIGGLNSGPNNFTVTDANGCQSVAQLTIPLADTDGDGTPDCNDGCPFDPNKIAVGLCGCGNPEPGTACDDGNAGTSNDVIGANCVCAGTVAGGVRVALHVFLEGPFTGTTMTDGLRAAGLIPTTEPYTALGFTQVGGGGETVSSSVFTPTGNNAIVDWVIIQLRDAANSSNIVRTRCALVQRDGDVVDLDGTSSVLISMPNASYFVAVRHRNHMGVMTSTAIPLTGTATTIDFTNPATAVYGTAAQKTVGSFTVLFAGNTVADNILKYTGASNDRDPILVRVGGTIPTNTVAGYWKEDVNLDATVKYTGASNDRDPILVNIGGTIPTNTKAEQLP